MKRHALSGFIALTLQLLSTALHAAPLGGIISAGTGTIDQAGVNTAVTQQSQNLAIDWQGFSIGAGESVNFIQPNVSSIALNRVLGQDASSILGSLNANGRVFILNPNGVLFGNTAQVSVGGLVASTLNLGNTDFMAGNYNFSNAGTAGAVINQGNLNSTDGGYIALLAPEVRNEGVITASMGTALLAAGDKVTLNFNNGSLLSYSVDQGSINALVENNQLIQADGGQVFMSARAADALSSAVINNTGIIQARTVRNIGGVIRLMGDMQVGTVNVDGTLDASAPNGGDGGFIETSAARVQIASDAQITSTSSTGQTGIWLIDPYDFTIAASGGDITGAALSTALGLGSVVIQTTDIAVSCTGATCGAGTAASNGDIFVNDVVAWGANLLTLNAWNNIYINASLQGSGTASLALLYGQGAVATGNASSYFVNAAVNLPAGANFSTKLGSDGTTKNFTVITSLGSAGSTTTTDLQGMSGDLTLNYALGADIDASATSGWNAGAGFTPVGTGTSLTTQYKGTFDGLGHTISNLTVNQPSANFMGLFGATGSGSIVRDIGLLGGSVTGLNYVGGLVGYSNSLISYTYNTGTVTGGAAGRAGGLVGQLNKPNNASPTLSYSYASGNVAAGNGGYAGGLVGQIGSYVPIFYCYATGNVSVTNGISGGLAGQIAGPITYSYSTGNVSDAGTPIAIGGLAGLGFGMSTANSFWDSTTSGQASSAGSGAVGMTTANMMTQANFTAATWDFTNTWFMVDGATRPFLRSEHSTTISNAHQLQLMGMDLAANYTLTQNIDVAESASAAGMWNTTSGFVPVGSFASPFTGTFDGLTYSISNLNINLPATNYVGMFGSISASTVTNANVSGSVTGFDYVGGIAGKTNALSTVSSSSFTGSVTGNTFVGGIVGFNDPSTISNVFVNGTVSGSSNIGGIAGGNLDSTIDIASFSGSVTGLNKVGGLTGENSGVSYISNVVVAGNVSGTTNVGGLTGTNTSTGSASTSFWDTDTTGQANADGGGAITGSTGLNITQMKQQSSFTGLDFGTTWRIYEGNSTPLIASFLTPLTITINNDSKTYDGLAYNGGSGYTFSVTPDANLQGSLTYTGSSQGAINAGDYVISVGGFYSNQRGYDITVLDNTLTIDKAALTLSTSDVNKVYDGGLAAPGTAIATVGSLFGTDSLSGGTFAFLDQNVGTGKTVTASGITVNDGNSGLNYNVSYTDNLNSSITQLGSVSWAGGATGNWSNAANWAGGATPSGSNVANVSIGSGVTVTYDIGTANLTSVSNGGDFVMAAGNLSTTGNFSTLGYTQSGGVLDVGGRLSINSAGAVTLGDMTVRRLDATAAGAITQLGGSSLAVTGLGTLIADNGAGTKYDITLANGGNDFQGRLNVDGLNVSLIDSTGRLILGNLAAGGTFDASLTGGNLVQAWGSSVNVAGATTLTADNGLAGIDNVKYNIILMLNGNDFQGAVNADGLSIKLLDGSGGLQLGSIGVRRFAITSTAGTITQSGGGISVTGLGALTADNGLAGIDNVKYDITLANGGNDFQGKLSADGRNINLTDSAGRLKLGNIVSTGTFDATSRGGHITQISGTSLNVTGTTTLIADNGLAGIDNIKYNIILLDAGNDFQSTVNADGNVIKLGDANTLNVNLISAASSTLSSGAALTIGGTVATRLTTTTGGGASNTLFNDTTVGNRLYVTSTGAVQRVNGTVLLTVNGTDTLTFNPKVTVNGAVGAVIP